jgi:mxaL protein
VIARLARLATPRFALAVAAIAFGLAAWDPKMTLPALRFHGVVVLDVTQSMNAEDYLVGGLPASRLAVAKGVLREAIGALPCGSRIGWGIFTEYRSLVLIAPLEVCSNFRELTSTLEAIDGRMAWARRSEVAKGINWALIAARALPEKPAIVFVTDGHEAPPVHFQYRPRIGGEPGEIAGLLVGAGGEVPVPIPKFDADARALGYWQADEVMQTDVFTQGRGASVEGERLAPTDTVAPPAAWPAMGNEHLTKLREGYLQLLASEQRFQYLRLEPGAAGAVALSKALRRRPLARTTLALVSLRPVFALLALVSLVWAYSGAISPAMRGWAQRRRPKISSAMGGDA